MAAIVDVEGVLVAVTGIPLRPAFNFFCSRSQVLLEGDDTFNSPAPLPATIPMCSFLHSFLCFEKQLDNDAEMNHSMCFYDVENVSAVLCSTINIKTDFRGAKTCLYIEQRTHGILLATIIHKRVNGEA